MSETFTATKDGQEIQVKVRKLSPEIRQEGERIYASAFNEAVSNKYNLRLEVTKILESKGLIDDEADEKKSLAMRETIKSLEVELRRGMRDGRRMTKEEGKELAFQIRKIRQDLAEIGSDTNELYSSTAESYAENERLQYWIFACTLNAETGKTYWKSFELFKKEADNEKDVFQKALKAFVANETGRSTDLERGHYENKWLIKQGYMNSDLQLVNANGHAVDEDGRLIDAEGRFVNEAGEFVDRFGYRIDENGDLVEPDIWDQAETKTSVDMDVQ